MAALVGSCGGASEDDTNDPADSSGTGAHSGESSGGGGSFSSGGTASGSASSGSASSGGSASGGGSSGDPVDCTGTFGNPQVLMEGVRRTSPALTGDELELFFTTGQTGQERFMRIRRASRSEPFGAEEPVPDFDAVCDPEADRSVDVSFDGLRAYVTCVLDFELEYPVYLVERANRSAPFESPSVIGNSPASPGLSGDELSIYGATLSGTTTSVARRSALADTFGPREVVPGLETVGFFAPGVSPDGLELYGAAGPDRLLSRAVRASLNEPFGTPEPLPALYEPYYATGAPEMSQDCRRMIYVGMNVLDDSSELWQLIQVER